MVLTQRLNNYTIETLCSRSITEKLFCSKRQKAVDREANYCYNRNKLASNVASKRCKNTTNRITESCLQGC